MKISAWIIHDRKSSWIWGTTGEEEEVEVLKFLLRMAGLSTAFREFWSWYLKEEKIVYIFVITCKFWKKEEAGKLNMFKMNYERSLLCGTIGEKEEIKVVGKVLSFE